MQQRTAIQELARQGLNFSDIQRESGFAWNTVKKYLAAPPPVARPVRPAVLTPGASPARRGLWGQGSGDSTEGNRATTNGAATKHRKGDAARAVFDSGNSPNVVAGLVRAKELALHTIAMTGRKGGKCAEVAELVLRAPSDSTPRIQELHITVGHILCELVEADLAQGP